MLNILDQITFKVEKNDIVAVGPSELNSITETLNDIWAVSLWQSALDTIAGKKPFPYWTGGDSMEIQVEEDGTWFREQEGWRHSDGIKLSNEETEKLISRFIEAKEKLES
ncbi:MAG TPA: hypothetical protein VFT59_04480 [Candidatus Saccharimonadales bacterium]|nr:hypothetical protein [Candidatus Saccharimonadales bacterium]